MKQTSQAAYQAGNAQLVLARDLFEQAWNAKGIERTRRLVQLATEAEKKAQQHFRRADRLMHREACS